MEPRNYAANADAAPPAAPGAPSNGYPRAADPGTGTEATTPGPHWFYKIGESLRRVIIDMGLVPDDADLSLLSQAIQAVIGTGFTESFVSTDQTITSGGPLTIAHGLSAKPRLVIASLVCTTASNGFAVGDEITDGIDDHYDAGVGDYGLNEWSDATYINIRFGSQTSVFIINGKSTGVTTAVTNSSWKLKLRAFL